MEGSPRQHVMIDTRLGPLAVRVRGDGPTAVLWHSLFVDDRSWHRVEDDLARERRLVIITGPGHGASTDPGSRYSIGDCAGAAADILQSLGAAMPVDWVGNAWGGHVGVVFAATWPERCRTLVTLCTPIHAYSRTDRLQVRLLLAAYRRLGPAGFIVDGVPAALLSRKTRAHDPEAAALVIDHLRAADRRALANAVESISIRRPDLSASLPSIHCPTLFATGSEHADWTPEQAETATRLLRDGSVQVIRDAAYLIPLEAPDRTLDLLRAFWGGHAGGYGSTRGGD